MSEQPEKPHIGLEINHPKCKESTCNNISRNFSAYCSEACKTKDYDKQTKNAIQSWSDADKLKAATVTLMDICKKNNIKRFLYSVNKEGRITVDVELKDAV